MRNSNGQFIIKHGKSFSSEYRSWLSMKARCLRPDEKHLKYKTIPIYQKWIDSFEDFFNDMGEKPNALYTIERIDNSKGYFPENCKWATRAEQNKNYSLNRIIEFNGIKKCVTDWSIETAIHRHRIYQRLNKGWSIEKTLTTPVISPKQA